MSTLCLSDMGELHDEWLREPRPPQVATAPASAPELPVVVERIGSHLLPDSEAVAA
jgi:hypothetical protein